MALVLSGSIDISGSMTATTIVVSAPGAAGMVSSSAQITELIPLMQSTASLNITTGSMRGEIAGIQSYTASLKGAEIVSSSTQIQNYNLFARTGSANTFFGNQTISGTITSQVNGSTFGTASATGRALIIQAGSTNQAIMFKNSAGGDGTLFINGTSTTLDYNFNTYSVGDALVIKNSGNVGIGTSSPSGISTYTTLDIRGATGGGIRMGVTGSSTPFNLQQAGTDAYLNNVASGAMYFFTNDIERMRITSGGNVALGDAGSATVRFQIKSGGSTGADYAIITRNSANTDLFFIRNDGLTNFGVVTNSPYNYNVTYSPRTAGLDASGGFGYITSTRESKGNIKPIQNIDFINQLNPVLFNYRKKDIDKKEFIDELYEDVYYGFIADEVELLDKNLVFYDALEDGRKKLSGVHYNSMIALLTKAIQELKAEIDGLIARIEALENN